MNILTVFTLLLATLSRVSVAEDPCKDNGGCDEWHGLCWKIDDNSRYCTCKAGFKQVVVNGTHTCVDINECFEPGACDANSLCENEEGTYSCRCRCGYVKDYTGRHCLDASKITGVCMVPPRCYHEFYWLRTMFWNIPFKIKYGKKNYFPDLDSEKIRISPPVKTKGICKCENGFSLNKCGFCEDIDECEKDKNICGGEESFCINTEGSYYCDCKPGYVKGPCGEKCYAKDDNIPALCEGIDLSSLEHSEVEAPNATFIRPIVLKNFGKCKSIEVGGTANQELDIDHDGVTDIRITWTCVDKTLDGSSSRSILSSYSEEEAKWDAWSCWTVCKATCWGGLQTRVRKCLHGKPGLKGCIGEGSQKRECYSGSKCNFRVRKNIKSLSEEEIEDLTQAMKKFKEDTTAKGFLFSASMHTWPYLCNGKPCRPTGGRMNYLAWQRLFLLQIELGMNRYLKDKTLGIPYWNWLEEDLNVPDLLWNKALNKKVNPFSNMTILSSSDEQKPTVRRSKDLFYPAIELGRQTWEDVTRHLTKPHIMNEFSKSLENLMEIIYLSACEKWTDHCEVSLANLKYSAFDPLYMFHHSQADRLWAVGQKNMERSGSMTWSAQTALDVLEPEGNFGRKLAPFNDENLSGHTLLHAINTLRDSFYYEELMGVKYDNLENDGFPIKSIEEFEVGGKALRTGGDERLYIGHYFKNVRKNVYINYYLGDDETPCSERKANGRVGSTVLLRTDVPYKNTIPTLLPVNAVVKSRLSEDFNVKACYTYRANCNELCPEARGINVMTMPDPFLIYHLEEQPIDIYKFDWASRRRMANWLINLDSRSHWIYFYGERSAKIVQVPSVSDWLSCNRKKGRPVSCAKRRGNVCMLPVGIYFLIDSDEEHCKSGLKTILVTRK